jgi:NAD(P)-dependent dehydrogenase (short-subunit alcohol dehydrogenase family)
MMAADLKGKTALVTGSGKKAGIGYGIVRKLAESGANVVIADLVGKETLRGQCGYCRSGGKRNPSE